MNKHERKLNALTRIDDDIIERQTKRRILLLNSVKRKRARKRLIVTVGSMAASLVLIATVVLLLVTLLGKTVPIYTGMSISDAPDNAQVATYRQSAAATTLLAAHADPTPAQALSATSLTESKEPYYAYPGQDIYITVHIDNPDSFEILSFTLNGRKYSSYMFESGSDLENLIVKINVGELDGITEYTIDAIKYVDGEDIKDVRMEGDRTVQILVSSEAHVAHTAGSNDLEFSISHSKHAITVTGLKNKNVTELVIPAHISGIPVTAIAAHAFKDDYHLTKVVVPSTVTTIGAGAFSGCASLREITLPFVGESAKEATDFYQYPFGFIFGESSYQGATAVNQVYYGSTFATTTETTYYIPASLNSVTLTGGNVLRGAFYRCSMLTTVRLPKHLTSIGAFGFGSCTSLSDIVLPELLVTLENHAFSECARLVNIDLPSTLKTIKTRAFMGCAITTVTLPAGLQSIKQGAFFRCSKLESISVEQGNTAFCVENGCLIDISAKTLLTATVGATIPTAANVKVIGDGAFSAAEWLTELTVPANIESIERYAFFRCKNLQAVHFAADSSLTQINENVFDSCTSLSGLALPAGVRSIKQGVFTNCSQLMSVTLPASLTSVSTNAFDASTVLADIYFTGTESAWNALGLSLPASITVHCLGAH